MSSSENANGNGSLIFLHANVNLWKFGWQQSRHKPLQAKKGKNRRSRVFLS
jgi:hypothetical protein